jgi:hypothetical protein
MPQLKVHGRTPLRNESRKDKVDVFGRLMAKHYWWNPFIEVTQFALLTVLSGTLEPQP